MIAVDSSSLVAFLAGQGGDDVNRLDHALVEGHVVLPPPVLSEVLSSPGLLPDAERFLSQIPLLELKPGFWVRAGHLRAKILTLRRKCRLADSLIAQACIDHDVVIITRDRDFRVLAGVAGLRLG